MNEDVSNFMNQINEMIEKNQIPENIKNMISQLSNSSSDNNSQTSASNSEFDMATIIKMKKMIDSINTNKDDPRTNLLMSLKPYLKESRKEKLDQYIQIFKMEKILEVLDTSGGETQK